MQWNTPLWLLLTHAMGHFMHLCSAQRQMDTTPALAAQELYKDFFILSGNNFTNIVLDNLWPWVIVFNEGSIDLAWKKVAAKNRGVIRFGLLDRSDKELSSTLGVKSTTAARVYPYGASDVKKSQFTDVNTPQKAVDEAERSIPNIMQSMAAEQSMSGIMLDAFTSEPTRFPVVFLLREKTIDEVPALFRAIALRLQRYFVFRVFPNPQANDFKVLGMEGVYKFTVPGAVVILVENWDDPAKTDISAIPFPEVQYGGKITYPALLKFFLQVNRQHRHTLPVVNMSEDEEILSATDVLKAEEDLFSITKSSAEKGKTHHTVLNERVQHEEL